MRSPWPLLVVAPLAAACVGKKTAADPSNSSPAALGQTAPRAGTPPETNVRVCARDAKEIAPCVEDCDRGLVSSCAILATRFENGDGIPRDTPQAARLHERACELRDATSCVTAARMHAAGRGVSPNRMKQMELLSRACRLGDSAACTVPAKAYATGAGVAQDEVRARELYEHACAGGVETACEAIGVTPNN